MGRVERNKEIKRNALIEAAYQLFNEKGFQNTTIEEITKEAGVAKGTFYLYFKNKKDIERYLIIEKSYVILIKAIEKASKDTCEPVDQFIKFLDYLIDYFKENEDLLKIIHKNLSWGIFTSIWYDKNNKDRIEKVEEVLRHFSDSVSPTEIPEEKKPIVLFIILEMFGSVLYSTIIDKEPVEIDVVKPVMFDSIRKLLK